MSGMKVIDTIFRVSEQPSSEPIKPPEEKEHGRTYRKNETHPKVAWTRLLTIRLLCVRFIAARLVVIIWACSYIEVICGCCCCCCRVSVGLVVVFGRIFYASRLKKIS